MRAGYIYMSNTLFLAPGRLLRKDSSAFMHLLVILHMCSP